MSILGVIGCILGFLIVIYLCYKDWSVYLATFVGTCVVIACNTLPFIDSLVGNYVSGMFTAVKSFFFMILFGCLQSKIYTESGAAYTIADTVMNLLLKENMSSTGKNLVAMAVILVIGVNGVGKTTSIGKIAHRLKGEGKRVLLCAADTFRAAAADQLEIWANRAECEIVRSVEGADPGAVLFDSLAAAKARGVDVVLCDTAGRLHNKVNLMNELSKLRKIIDRELPDAAKETLLVLDATTGQNGLQQAKVFRETAGLTGIILTKLDGTAKGGICVAIAQELGVPVKYVGLGEGIDDLQPFNAEEYVKALI